MCKRQAMLPEYNLGILDIFAPLQYYKPFEFTHYLFIFLKQGSLITTAIFKSGGHLKK
jgi:hypothetical protein